jgi:phosphoesterase RecJ-like protein
MHNIKQAKEKILEAKSIAISGHINPDGDSIGSLLSLGLGIEQLGKKVYMVSCDGVPQVYRFLPSAGRIVRKIRETPDLAISVDCSTKEILGKNFAVFKKAKSILEIDHHEFRKPFGELRVVDYKASAVGELIYKLLKELDVVITKDIAQNILTSIIVETNSFRVPTIRAFTFEVCSRLMQVGIDLYKLAESVFWSRTKESVVLLGVCLARCKFISNGKIVWSIVRRSDMLKVKGKDEDADSIITDMNSIKGVKIAILFREKDKKTLRVSLRSKGKVNVGKLAESYGGGGHFDAAGCLVLNSKATIGEFLNSAKSLLKEYKEGK